MREIVRSSPGLLLPSAGLLLKLPVFDQDQLGEVDDLYEDAVLWNLPEEEEHEHAKKYIEDKNGSPMSEMPRVTEEKGSKEVTAGGGADAAVVAGNVSLSSLRGHLPASSVGGRVVHAQTARRAHGYQYPGDSHTPWWCTARALLGSPGVQSGSAHADGTGAGVLDPIALDRYLMSRLQYIPRLSPRRAVLQCASPRGYSPDSTCRWRGRMGFQVTPPENGKTETGCT
ncbi:hypothetical protein MAR_019605, partial [Mya arenaria]